jgi:hypothetical protein
VVLGASIGALLTSATTLLTANLDGRPFLAFWALLIVSTVLTPYSVWKVIAEARAARRRIETIRSQQRPGRVDLGR